MQRIDRNLADSLAEARFATHQGPGRLVGALLHSRDWQHTGREIGLTPMSFGWTAWSC
jgi:hypothetical protein